MNGIIYYTHNQLREPIFSTCQEWILKSGLPITSCSLKPIDFGNNVVLNADKGPVTMFRQILTALENAKEKYVFFCEHDVLYHPSHFDFAPEKDDTFYYNSNVWRWSYLEMEITTYSHLISVSGLCVNRELAIEFYKNRMKIIEDNKLGELPTYGNPTWAREMGYEPGKFNSKYNEHAKIEERKSKYPNIDIRHYRNMTPAKMKLEDFKKKPIDWQESTIEKLEGWDLKSIFDFGSPKI